MSPTSCARGQGPMAWLTSHAHAPHRRPRAFFPCLFPCLTQMSVPLRTVPHHAHHHVFAVRTHSPEWFIVCTHACHVLQCGLCDVVMMGWTAAVRAVNCSCRAGNGALELVGLSWMMTLHACPHPPRFRLGGDDCHLWEGGSSLPDGLVDW